MADLAIPSAATLTASTLAKGDLIPIHDISASAGSKGSKATLSAVRESIAGMVDVADAATGGSGTSGSPWTGWESAITWAGWTTYKFRTGHYSHDGSTNFLFEGIQLIGAAGVYIHSTGANYCFLMDASQVASDWVTNVRVENINVIGNGTTTKMGFMLVGVRNGIFKHLSAKNVTDAACWTEACVTNTLENFRCTYNELTGGSGGAGPFATKPKYGIVTTCRGDNAGALVSNDYSTTWTITNPVIEGVSHFGIWLKDTAASQTSYGHTIINGTCESLVANVIGTFTGASYNSGSYVITLATTTGLMVGAYLNPDTNAHLAPQTRILSIDSGTQITVNRKPLTTGTNDITINTPGIGMMVDSFYNTIISIDLEANDGACDMLLMGSYNNFFGVNSGGYLCVTGSYNSFTGGQIQHIIIDGGANLYPQNNSFPGVYPIVSFTDNGIKTHRSAGQVQTTDSIGGSLPALAGYKIGPILVNTTAAAVGAQQVSPVQRWTGNGWKTDATAASVGVNFQAGVVPIQGAAYPSGKWALQADCVTGYSGTFRDILSVESVPGSANVVMKLSSQWSTTAMTQAVSLLQINNGYAATLNVNLANSATALYDTGGGGMKIGNGGDAATKIMRGYDGTEKGFWLYPDDAIMQLGQNHATAATDQTIRAHDVTTGTGGALTLSGGKGSAAGGALKLGTHATNGAVQIHLTIGADGSFQFGGGAIGFFNATPASQAGAITNPAGSYNFTGSDTVSQSQLETDMASMATAVNAIITALHNIGITA